MFITLLFIWFLFSRFVYFRNATEKGKTSGRHCGGNVKNTQNKIIRKNYGNNFGIVQ